MENKKDAFIKQAGILAAAGIVCRIIGILYRSPLAAIIGDEGNGYYGSAYNIYTIILLISSYSIPSAISKVIAEKLALKEYTTAQRIFHCAFYYVIAVGGVASLITFFGAGIFVEKNCKIVLRVFAPTIFLSGLLGVLRGYFQAHKTMVQTSLSQIFEQILNAAVSLGAAYILKRMVLDKDTTTQAVYGAMGSALGTGAGVLTALLFMWAIYNKKKKAIHKRIKEENAQDVPSNAEIMKVILALVTPFILSTFIYNFSTSLDETIYRKILKLVKDVDVSQIATWYGIYSGKAVVIANIPIAIASAVSVAMIPNISSKFATGDEDGAREKVHIATLATMLIAIPASVGLFVLATPVVSFLFPGQTSIDAASSLLKALSITVAFYCLSTLSNAVLQGIGKVNIPVKNALIALIVQTIVLALCLLLTNMNLYALAVATITYSLLMCILNARSVAKYLEYNDNAMQVFILPASAAIIMGAAAHFTYLGMSLITGNAISLIVAFLVAVLVYGFLILRMHLLTDAEMLEMPFGGRILKVATKLHL